jgi:prophage regulatory protein
MLVGMSPIDTHSCAWLSLFRGPSGPYKGKFMAQNELPALDDKRRIKSRTTLSGSMLYRLIAEGKFPRPIKIGRRSYWDSREVSSWIESQLTEGSSRPHDRQKFSALGRLSGVARKAKKAGVATPAVAKTAVASQGVER